MIVTGATSRVFLALGTRNLGRKASKPGIPSLQKSTTTIAAAMSCACVSTRREEPSSTTLGEPISVSGAGRGRIVGVQNSKRVEKMRDKWQRYVPGAEVDDGNRREYVKAGQRVDSRYGSYPPPDVDFRRTSSATIYHCGDQVPCNFSCGARAIATFVCSDSAGELLHEVKVCGNHEEEFKTFLKGYRTTIDDTRTD
jgi:hypothetical protein